MSIIYDALKKTQARFSLPGGPHNPQKRKMWHWLLIGFIVFGFAGCGIVVLVLFYRPQKIVTPLKQAASPARAPQAIRQIQGNAPGQAQQLFKLEGIVEMDKEYFAVINNAMLRVGDYINEAEVVGISPQVVSLNARGQIITLRLE